MGPKRYSKSPQLLTLFPFLSAQTYSISKWFFLFSSVFLGNTEGVKDLAKKDRSSTNGFVAVFAKKKVPKALKRVAKKFPFSDHGFFFVVILFAGGNRL